MHHVLRCSIFALLATPVFAQEPAAAPAPAPSPDFKPIAGNIDLKDGDTLVFLGDSITHQCLYTQYVEDYYYTRYPKLHLHFHNAGVGGDKASNALVRFDDDVASYKPKYVTILLGMNDGGYTRYEQPIFDTYQRDMNTLLDKIQQIGAQAIPMTPTMHDARSARMANHGQEPRDTYYNGVLALYGTWLREQGQVRGLGFVDMWSPLNDISLEQRKTNPKWTMIADAVHPGPVGQTVMAAAVVNDMVPRSNVAQITIGQDQGQLTSRALHGTIGNLQKTDKGLSFNFAAEALPWVLPPEAAEGVKLTHIGHKFANEKVTVHDLPPGKYQLKIDGQAIGTYTAGQLATGVELEENDKTPQYQQALKVALLNKKRNDEAMRPLRDQWAALKVKRHELDRLKSTNAETLADKQAEFDKWYAGFPGTVEGLVAKAKGFEDQIYQANQPQAHQYEVTLE